VRLAVYLAGEIHTDWRGEIARGLDDAGLDVDLLHPVTDHEASDVAGVEILGDQGQRFWNDQLGAGLNAVRTRSLVPRSDVVVVRFASRYGEWNGALDAGRALALGKPLVTLHPPELDHALKEVDRAAVAVARSTEQVVGILGYAFGDMATRAAGAAT